MLKKLNLILFSGLLVFGLNVCAYAESEDVFDEVVQEEIVVESPAEESEVIAAPQPEIEDVIASEALDNYVVEGSLFEKITTLEQEKVVMQLEKERAQLDLDLERLNAEKIKLQMELDTLSGRAEQQQHELEAAKAQLEIQTEKLKRQREAIEEDDEEPVKAKPQPKKEEPSNISTKYKLINVVGVANQLQATLEEVSSGQNKRVSVGKELDGYVVKSISLNEGVVFEKDGTKESLNIGK